MTASSTQKVLKVRNPQDENTMEKRERKERVDEANVKAKIGAAHAADPISAPVEFGEYLIDQVPTQVFGPKIIDDFKGPGPKYRFKRWYLGRDIVVDTFLTDKEYDEADVEGRRGLCHKYGFRYAALGPMHSVQPHEDKARRAQYPSEVEQLGLV